MVESFFNDLEGLFYNLKYLISTMELFFNIATIYVFISGFLLICIFFYVRATSKRVRQIQSSLAWFEFTVEYDVSDWSLEEIREFRLNLDLSVSSSGLVGRRAREYVDFVKRDNRKRVVR